MTGEKMRQGEHARPSCFGSESIPEGTGNCPMADMCQGLFKDPRIGLLTLIPGLLFVCLGILILIEPKVLTWLMAGIFILLGLAMFALAFFLRHVSAGSHNGDRP